MYAGGDAQMNGDMPHDGGHGGGGHAIGEELKKTGRYETINETKRLLNSNLMVLVRGRMIYLPSNVKPV